MFRLVMLALAGSLVTQGAASAVTFSYKSAQLSPVSNGGIAGAKVINITFSAPAAPNPGACVMTQALKYYSDGADTKASLRAANYIITKNVIVDGQNEHKVPVTYANVCLASDGQTVTGIYQLYAINGSNLFLVNNQQPGSTDLAQFDIYFGGQIPQVYSSGSSVPGVWATTR